MSQERYLYLDGSKMPIESFITSRMNIYYKEQWEIVRNTDCFIQSILQLGLPDFISFGTVNAGYGDDTLVLNLNIRPSTVTDCARWLIDYCTEHNKKLPRFHCHSLNRIEIIEINHLLEPFSKLVMTREEYEQITRLIP